MDPLPTSDGHWAWEGVNIGWQDGTIEAPPGWNEPSCCAGVGEVWCGGRWVADVAYELSGFPDGKWRSGAPVLRRPEGTLTLLVGDWWTLRERPGASAALHLADGQSWPFLATGGWHPTLRVRARDPDLALEL